MKEILVEKAIAYIKDIVRHSLLLTPEEKVLVVFDEQYELTNIITEAYRKAVPRAHFINFDTTPKTEILAEIDGLAERDLVVLIQSTSFQLNEFRIRLHLFKKKLKVIEHMHLVRNSEKHFEVYVNSLEYDTSWYRSVGPKLKNILTTTQELRIKSGESELVVTGGLEIPKLNIGDYSGMENIGGTFSIGEVFTESLDFSKMNGGVMIYAYANQNFHVEIYEPFRVDIKEGLIVGWADTAPESFPKIIEMVKLYERPLIREVGFGLSRAITKEHYLEDITAFERILGMHLSLGEKHSTYKKTGITTHKTKFHIDLFPLVDQVRADGKVIFEAGTYLV